MANQKLTALTALTSIASGDIIYIVDDPGGSPVGKKITVANLFGTIPTVLTITTNGVKLNFFEDDVSSGDAFFKLSNATGGAGLFIPMLHMKANNTGGLAANYIVADCRNDGVSDTGEALLFSARKDDSSGVTNRKAFLFANDATAIMTLQNNGDVAIAGALSKGSGTFLIDHPLDPTNKTLSYGFTESPRYELIHRGTVQLSNGKATVNIDNEYGLMSGTFEALVQNAEVMSVSIKNSFARVKYGDISGAEFEIEADDLSSNEFVNWLVIAERADAFVKHTGETDKDGHLINEVDKKPLADELDGRIEFTDDAAKVGESFSEASLPGIKGYYNHPKAHGKSDPKVKRTKIFKEKKNDKT